MARAETGGCAARARWASPAVPIAVAPIAVAPIAAILAATALVLALLLGPATGPVAAESPQEVQSTAEQVIKRLGLQTQLPRRRNPFMFHLSLPPETLWVVVAIGLAVLAYAFRDMIPALRAGRGGTWEEEGATGDLGLRPPEMVLGTADELAAQGRYVEAMHVLLLQGIAEMRHRLDEQFADSFTSREILRSTRLPEAARDSLRDVVTRVEWTYFGEHPAVRDDYLACRASFNTLARVLHGSAPA